MVLFWLGRERMGLAGRVNGNDANGGLQKVWDDMGLGVGGRVRALVLERLRANSREGVVGRWQEVCSSIPLLVKQVQKTGCFGIDWD